MYTLSDSFIRNGQDIRLDISDINSIIPARAVCYIPTPYLLLPCRGGGEAFLFKVFSSPFSTVLIFASWYQNKGEWKKISEQSGARGSPTFPPDLKIAAALNNRAYACFLSFPPGSVVAPVAGYFPICW